MSGPHSLLTSTSTDRVLAIGPHGEHVSTDTRKNEEHLTVPLAHLVKSVSNVIEDAVLNGRATWWLPGGGGSISFVTEQMAPGLMQLEVWPTGEMDVVPIDELRAAARDLVSRATEYLRVHLPPEVWRSWVATLR